MIYFHESWVDTYEKKVSFLFFSPQNNDFIIFIPKKSIKIKPVQKSVKILKSTKFHDPEITSINSLFRHISLVNSTNKKKVGLVILLSDKVEVRTKGMI